ncbi:MAG: hypothetical protein GY789_21375 [Hyphomicrobiales bacterium]|nr:hypothetical protein [Hyphomicrobiales bacterium]
MAHEVTTGQQYVQVNAYRNIWEVKDVFQLSDDIAHARLARIDEPSIVKTVSCISLAEGAFFQLLANEDAEEGAVSESADLADGAQKDLNDANAQWRRNADSSHSNLKAKFFKRWLRS